MEKLTRPPLADEKKALIEEILKNVPFDGFEESCFVESAKKLGHDPIILDALFPERPADIVKAFSQWADEEMLASLANVSPADLSVRGKIKLAVKSRMKCLWAHKEAVRKASAYWSRPDRGLQGGKSVWYTADAIWDWAGDTSEDINHYTKRMLLSGVVTSTILYWLGNDERTEEQVFDFLDRRIEQVVTVGKNIGGVTKPLNWAYQMFKAKGNA